jgi:hypothetical protein
LLLIIAFAYDCRTQVELLLQFVIPAKVGIQLFEGFLDPGACPGHDPGFAGVTTKILLTGPS